MFLMKIMEEKKHRIDYYLALSLQGRESYVRRWQNLLFQMRLKRYLITITWSVFAVGTYEYLEMDVLEDKKLKLRRLFRIYSYVVRIAMVSKYLP